METNLIFEEVYRISMICLRINGAHPSIPRDRKWVLQFFIMHGMFTLFNLNCAYNFIFINIKENDFPNACSNGVFLVVYVVVSFNYLVLLWHQKNLQAVTVTQQEYFDFSRGFTAEEQVIVQSYIEKGQWVSKLWLKSVIITATLFPIKNFIDSAYSAYIGDFKLYSFSENTYPGVSSIQTRIDIYLIIYVAFILYAVYSGTMYTGFSPFGPICILNACAQLDIVIKRIEEIYKEEGFNKVEKSKQLNDIVYFIQKIYSFVEKVNDIFQLLYEICIKAAAILIPVSLFLLIEGFRDGKLYLDYVMFSYLASLLCFVPCYYSDKLKEKGDDLCTAMYSCGWEKFYDKNTRLTIVITLIRATRPLSIKTIFRTVCLEAFSELCKEAYVIFNLLYAVLG